MIRAKKNIAIKGKHGRPFPVDVIFEEEEKQKPVLVFCHGYKGFKDWGAWNLLAEALAARGILVVKFNFAFNGGTLQEPIDFPDLEAFGKNTYSKELDDLEVLFDWLFSKNFPCSKEADLDNLTLMGHSRGGGIAVVKASEDLRVRKLITLAAVSDFGSRFPSGAELEAWKKKGISYIKNARTGQKMPHLFDFFRDYKENEERLSIWRAARNLEIPALVIHGTDDPTVAVEDAYDLYEWIRNSELFLLKGSNHVFETSHPWNKEQLPEALEEIIRRASSFTKEKQP